MLMDLKKLERFVGRRRVAFIGSIDEGGFPNMKAMLPPRKREGLRCFYLSTNTASLRVAQYGKNPNASLYFYRKGVFSYRGVMLVGTVEVLKDAASKEMIWRTGDKRFYPKGVADPDYCVLRFTAREGRSYRDLRTERFLV